MESSWQGPGGIVVSGLEKLGACLHHYPNQCWLYGIRTLKINSCAIWMKTLQTFWKTHLKMLSRKLHSFYQGSHELTHCGLVTDRPESTLAQEILVAWFPWPNVDWSSKVFCVICQEAIWQQLLTNLMHNWYSQITLLKLLLITTPSSRGQWVNGECGGWFMMLLSMPQTLQYAGWHATMRQMRMGIISPELKIWQIGKHAGSILRKLPWGMFTVNSDILCKFNHTIWLMFENVLISFEKMCDWCLKKCNYLYRICAICAWFVSMYKTAFLWFQLLQLNSKVIILPTWLSLIAAEAVMMTVVQEMKSDVTIDLMITFRF